MSCDGDAGHRRSGWPRAPGCAFAKADWILEGGAIDGDGTGLVVTTEQCLLNPNRNPGLTRDEVEARLLADLGFERVLWLGAGADQRPYRRPCRQSRPVRRAGAGRDPEPAERRPQRGGLQGRRAAARRAGLDVVTMPSPGRVDRGDGEIIPASYMNFYIGNAAVVVPQYGAPNDEAAVDVVQALFPDRVAIGLRADHILTGGGSFHCISQQVPA